MKIADKAIHLGIAFRREHAPEQLPRFARNAEDIGFDELWVVEDCFYASGIASAATGLAVSESLAVGLGIMPAVVRNPVFAAMEIATLARIYPGRFLPGFGHGVESWMRQIGAFPQSPLKALEETVYTVKRLLRGERINFEGNLVQLAEAELIFPTTVIPPISLGVRGQKSLLLSGRIADGTILAEYASPQYVKWAREQITIGQLGSNIIKHHRLTVYAVCYIDNDTSKAHKQARSRVISAIHRGRIDVQLKPMGILAQVEEMRRRNALEDEMPDEWISQLTIVGNPEDCFKAILQYIHAGADTIVLVPPPDESLEMLNEKFHVLLRFFK